MYLTVPYRTVPHRIAPTIPYRLIPYRILMHCTVPYRTASYRTAPYRTLPTVAGNQLLGTARSRYRRRHLSLTFCQRHYRSKRVTRQSSWWRSVVTHAPASRGGSTERWSSTWVSNCQRFGGSEPRVFSLQVRFTCWYSVTNIFFFFSWLKSLELISEIQCLISFWES